MVIIEVGPNGTAHVQEFEGPMPILVLGPKSPTTLANLFNIPLTITPNMLDQDHEEDLTEAHTPAISIKEMLLREDNIFGRALHNMRKRNRGQKPRYKTRH